MCHVRTSWIKVDDAGKEEKLNESLVSIAQRCGLQRCDLRPLFLVYPANHSSTVLVRGNTIVMNLNPIHCLVTANEFFLRESVEIDHNKRLAATMLGGEFRKDVPFEYKAIEAALGLAWEILENDFSTIKAKALPLLNELPNKLNRSNLERVRRLKSDALGVKYRAEQMRGGVMQLLERFEKNEDTRKLCKCEDNTMVQEILEMVEDYHTKVDKLLFKVSRLDEDIRSTEEMAKILDRTQRDKAILVISVISVMMMFFSIVTGAFGMNVPVPWAEKKWAFQTILEICGLITGTVVLIGGFIFRKYNLV